MIIIRLSGAILAQGATGWALSAPAAVETAGGRRHLPRAHCCGRGGLADCGITSCYKVFGLTWDISWNKKQLAETPSISPFMESRGSAAASSSAPGPRQPGPDRQWVPLAPAEEKGGPDAQETLVISEIVMSTVPSLSTPMDVEAPSAEASGPPTATKSKAAERPTSLDSDTLGDEDPWLKEDRERDERQRLADKLLMQATAPRRRSA